MSEIKPYCIVGFGPSEAYLVQATEANAVNVSTGLKIDPKGLRLNYIDLEQEAGMELQRQRTSPDPRILSDPNITLSQVLKIYPHLMKEVDGECLETRLQLCRSLSKDNPDYFAGQVNQYDQDRSLRDNELYQKILAELKSKVPYEPKPVEGIGSRGWIDSGGYVLCTIELSDLDFALSTLHATWNSIKEDAEKSKVFLDVCRGKSVEFEQVRQWLKDVAKRVS